jgi:transcriptional regulator with XRE-family HTH domain
VAENLAKIRKKRGLDQRELAARVTQAGRPVSASILSKMEKGDRRVDVDDLIALSVALNVAPLALLLPGEGAGRDRHDLTANVQATEAEAWQWGMGERALPGAVVEGSDQQQQVEYEWLSVSPAVRGVRQHPAGRATRALIEDVDRLIEASGFVVEGDGTFRRRLSLARGSVERVAAEVDRVAAEYSDFENETKTLRGEGDSDG